MKKEKELEARAESLKRVKQFAQERIDEAQRDDAIVIAHIKRGDRDIMRCGIHGSPDDIKRIIYELAVGTGTRLSELSMAQIFKTMDDGERSVEKLK